jgi:dienelactone hydrolase
VNELEAALKRSKSQFELYRYDAQHAFMNEARPQALANQPAQAEPLGSKATSLSLSSGRTSTFRPRWRAFRAARSGHLQTFSHSLADSPIL